MFRQHKIICENKEVISYLFLFDQDIDRDIMKNIFNQLSTHSLEERIHDYFNENHIKFMGQHVKIVYLSTIIKDFYLHQKQVHISPVYADNVISFYR